MKRTSNICRGRGNRPTNSKDPRVLLRATEQYTDKLVSVVHHPDTDDVILSIEFKSFVFDSMEQWQQWQQQLRAAINNIEVYEWKMDSKVFQQECRLVTTLAEDGMWIEHQFPNGRSPEGTLTSWEIAQQLADWTAIVGDATRQQSLQQSLLAPRQRQ